MEENNEVLEQEAEVSEEVVEQKTNSAGFIGCNCEL